MKKISNKLALRKRANVTTKKSVEQVQEATVDTVNKHLVRRWGKFKEVRRFVFGWLILVFLLAIGVVVQSSALDNYYLEEAPAQGGAYFEGVVGEFSSLNPIFSISSADSSATKLIFSYLFKYDDNNKLIGDLATGWEVDKGKVVYTVKIRNDVYWHDGQKLTADDVVFTYRAIKDSSTDSPFAQSWKGIEIKALDEYTVSFVLPNKYTPFPHSLTGGIIPEHLLGNVPFDELRSTNFNFEPVGSGPFVFDRLFVDDEKSQIRLVRNENYYAKPALIKVFEVVAYEDYPAMLKGFRGGELSAITALRSFDIEELADIDDTKEINFPLFSQVFIFLNAKDPLLKNADIRKALVYATDKSKIFHALGSRYPIGDSQLLKDQLGYDKNIVQPDTNIKKANDLLEKAGWKRGKDGVRIKDGQQLKIDIVSQNSDEYPTVLSQVQKDWLKVGVIANLSLISDQDFSQTYIAPHDFQALTFGVTQGVDPDVFPYWHSSQAVKGGFNLSNYKSAEADDALEAGRTRSNSKLRAEKYKSFLEEWTKDNPAIALYRPVFNYLVRNSVGGVESRSLSVPADRFNDVTEWYVETQKVRKSL